MNLKMLFCSFFLILTLIILETPFAKRKFSKFSDVVEKIITKNRVAKKFPFRRVLTKTSTDRSTTKNVNHKSENEDSSEERGNEIVASSTLTPGGLESCPSDSKPCKKPKPFKKTKHLVCYYSKSCADDGSICCPDSCYEHKICKNKAKPSSSWTTESANPANANAQRGAEHPSFKAVKMKMEICPTEETPCLKPANSKESERYKCVDDGCPEHFKCCEDSCFVHKICKKAKETFTEMSVLVSSDDNDTDAESTIKSVLTGSDESNYTVAPKESKKANESKESEESKETEKSATINKNGTETSTTKNKDGSTKKSLCVTDKQNSEDPKECPADNLECSSPLNENDTKQFDCDQKKCPENFVCCKDNCFAHKICKEPSSSNGRDILSSRIREVCPAVEETCLLPADIKNAVFCTSEANCTSGHKCCSDACFKRNVCKKAVILIEARVETCPEEPTTCNSFLREIKIHPRYICNANMSNCPEDYKCCPDKCHNTDLCKSPNVQVVIKKLIPTTTNLNESQNAAGPVATNQNATIPKAGNTNATSSPSSNQISSTPQNTTNNGTHSESESQNAPTGNPDQNTVIPPGKINIPALQSANQILPTLQSTTETATTLQTGNANQNSAAQKGNSNLSALQSANPLPTTLQTTPKNAVPSESGNKNEGSLQAANPNQNTAAQPGNSKLPPAQPANANPSPSASTFPKSGVPNPESTPPRVMNPSAYRPGNPNPVNLKVQKNNIKN